MRLINLITIFLLIILTSCFNKPDIPIEYHCSKYQCILDGEIEDYRLALQAGEINFEQYTALKRSRIVVIESDKLYKKWN